MTPEMFAASLNTWVTPGVIARIADDLERGGYPKGDTIFQITSRVLDSATSAGLNQLVDLYLAHFHLDADLLELARLYRPRSPDRIWERIANARFTGRATYDTGQTVDGRPVILQINAPEQDVRLVWWPLHVLADVVGQLASYWKAVSQRIEPDAVHHDHRCEWQFLSWIDMIVARAHGFHLVGRAAMRSTCYDYDVSSIGRFCSANGALPIDRETHGQLKLFAELIHKDHHEYFDSPGLPNA
ncbi:hypothetical protein [Mesorhizobium sp.]|uniref:hypothetical protein n=1 Tax=Mesorhizobium sp. TaxID=1871066 RepID=UPI000FEA75B1|nr:hypothetical protein [Mesorhizobium sp.]RWA81312.1 MAG: hypothetical protein EOQ30_19235 [Mesorhizobium sp.]